MPVSVKVAYLTQYTSVTNKVPTHKDVTHIFSHLLAPLRYNCDDHYPPFIWWP